MNKTFTYLLTLCIGLLSLVACTTSPNEIQVDAAWVRAAAAEGNTAAYMDITNRGRADVTLIRIEGDLAPMIQIHETSVENDIASMQQVDNGLVIPAGSTITLAPGGLHVMFMNLPNAIEENTRAEVTLIFDNGATIVVDAPVLLEAPDS